MNTTVAANWTERAAALKLDRRAVIDGQRRDSLGGQTFANMSPLHGRSIGEVERGNADDIRAAVVSARQTFDDGR